MIEIAFFNSVPEAMMFQGILEEVGIECILEPDNGALAAYTFSLAMDGGVRLLVVEGSEVKALGVLKDAGYVAQ